MIQQPRAAVPTRGLFRAEIRARRTSRSLAEQHADDQLRDARVLALVSELLDGHASSGAATLACYLSRPGEPGTLDLVGELAEHYRLLVPKLSVDKNGRRRPAPDWALFEGTDQLVPGVFGIPDPAGLGLGGAALRQADVVIAAALCAGVDGSRLGTGGGWFDRALLHRRADAPVIVLLNEDEVRQAPQEPHDQPVHWLVTPHRTIKTTCADQPGQLTATTGS